MKKLLGIVVLGLIWCNVGVAKIITIEKCYENYDKIETHLMINDDPPVLKTDIYGPNDSVWSEKSYEEYINPTITKTDAFDPFKNETKESEIVRKIVKDNITIDTERQLLSFITWWSDGEINKHNYKIIDYADGIVFTEKQESLHLIDNYYQDKTKRSYVVDLNNYTIRYKYYRYYDVPFNKNVTITYRNLTLLCQPSDQSDGDIAGYLDYWWAVILIIAITFFIFTQSGKRLKKIRRK